MNIKTKNNNKKKHKIKNLKKNLIIEKKKLFIKKKKIFLKKNKFLNLKKLKKGL